MIPGEDAELIEASDKIPAGGDVASYEDSKRETGYGVHIPSDGARGDAQIGGKKSVHESINPLRRTSCMMMMASKYRTRALHR